MMTTQQQVRRQFWLDHPSMESQARARGTKGKGQNAQVCDTRCAFVAYVDHLQRSGVISEALAQRVTL